MTETTAELFRLDLEPEARAMTRRELRYELLHPEPELPYAEVRRAVYVAELRRRRREGR